ncbi:MAG TPA: hypothetical protein VFI13_13265 [Gemmatimonadales bacterium]|nr:hypothetical protein [Gemmatimonadales bacterium]
MTLARALRFGLLAGPLAFWPLGRLTAQGAINPVVAPHAADLARAGERGAAKTYLGQYLSRSSDDAKAWLQLGKLYLDDAREWHLRGHVGDPDAAILLDFAATSFDQTIRLREDSGTVLRGFAQSGRDLLTLEALGWDGLRTARESGAVVLPAPIVEFGLNLVASCPSGGVLLTGDPLETLAVWYAELELGRRPDLLPLEPSLYATDARYRAQMARALGVDTALVVQRALALVATHRPVCLAPMADAAAMPDGSRTPVRLVLVSGPAAAPADLHLAFTDFIAAERAGHSIWVPELLRIYQVASRQNPLLCQSLFAQLGDRPVGACGR